jgi:hypothetical protein
VALCACPIEDHLPGSDTRWQYVGGEGVYGIPYRALIPQYTVNLLVVGRCLSATHEAQASLRNSAQAFATGEAAGYATALAEEAGNNVADVDAERLRERIVEAGGIL